MRKRDLLSSLVWLGIGILFCIGGVRHEHGLFVSGIPGPGFLPFLAGIGLILLSLILLRSAAPKKREEDGNIHIEAFLPERDSRKRLLFVLSALIFYVIVLEHLGFALTTLIFMIFLLRIEPRRWLIILTIAFLSTAASYILFRILLKVQLPRGVLGI